MHICKNTNTHMKTLLNARTHAHIHTHRFGTGFQTGGRLCFGNVLFFNFSQDFFAYVSALIFFVPKLRFFVPILSLTRKHTRSLACSLALRARTLSLLPSLSHTHAGTWHAYLYALSLTLFCFSPLVLYTRACMYMLRVSVTFISFSRSLSHTHTRRDMSRLRVQNYVIVTHGITQVLHLYMCDMTHSYV